MNETMKDGERAAFEAAWAAQYPDHGKCAFLRSGIDLERYATTRVQDGWLMWQARAASPQSGEESDEKFIAEHGHRLAKMFEIDAYDIADRDAQIRERFSIRAAAPQAALSVLADVLFALTERQKGNIIRSEDAYVDAARALLTQAPTERMSLSDELRAVILEASRSLAVRADELKASNTSMDGTWCDAEEQAQYEAEVRLIERLQDVYNAAPTERMSDADDAARYRWLKENCFDWAAPGDGDSFDYIALHFESDLLNRDDASVDVAIDAARKAEIERDGGKA